jgi:hypothetical protein
VASYFSLKSTIDMRLGYTAPIRAGGLPKDRIPGGKGTVEQRQGLVAAKNRACLSAGSTRRKGAVGARGEG